MKTLTATSSALVLNKKVITRFKSSASGAGRPSTTAVTLVTTSLVSTDSTGRR
jgi:hypothetical protein